MPLPPPRTLQTQRLVLRPMREDDAPAAHLFLSDPEVARYSTHPPHERLEQSTAYIGENVNSPIYCSWALTEPDGPDAGLCLGALTLVDVREAVAEIGLSLRHDRWGRGYMREAAEAVIALGFSELGLRRIEADVDPENHRSIALLERLGFAREGLLRATWKTHIGIRDTLVLALLNEKVLGDDR